MKKTLFSILLIAMTLTMLSSCVYVDSKSYDITCYNNTSSTITDWCVHKKGKKDSIANDDRECTIYPNRSDTIRNLSTGDYKIYFSFKNKWRLHEEDYQSTGYFWLDEDVTFYVAEREIYTDRSALSSKSEQSEPQLVVICSNGLEIPLVKSK